ncbi:MAG: guanylate kinase [Phycisphaerales bacterium]|nr:guanylate kinase [Phycisphaerales bacterium]
MCTKKNTPVPNESSHGYLQCYKKEDSIIIITAPSGTGKTSVIKSLLMKYQDNLAFSISATTRSPRLQEIDGKDYYFISSAEFEQKVKQDEFLECEMVYEGIYYGTLKSEMQRIWDKNKTPILDIDVAGALAIQKKMSSTPTSAIRILTIFIEPPSVAILNERLNNRGTESSTNIKIRLAKATIEIASKKSFQYKLVNDHLAETVTKVEHILKKEGLIQ